MKAANCWCFANLLLILTVAPVPGLAADEVPERIFEFSPFAGALKLDGNSNYKSTSPLAGFRATINNSPRWALEGVLAYSPGQEQTGRASLLESYDAYIVRDVAGQPVGILYSNFVESTSEFTSDSSLLMAGGSIVMHLSEKTVRPFLSLGGGFITDLSGGSEAGEPGSEFSHPYADFGGGIKLYRRQGWSIRLEAHDIVTHQDDLLRPNPQGALFAAIRDGTVDSNNQPTGGVDGVLGQEPFNPDEALGKRWLHNWALTASVAVPLGWVWKDGDNDRVADRFDQEKTTAPQVVVDPHGRGIDTDGDKVFDGIDKCASTPLGAIVNLEGCPSDPDGDGVFDGIDEEPNTPKGAIVDAKGRSADADGDGVADGIDLCADTPLGTEIDEKGCAKNPFEEKLLRGEHLGVLGVGFDAGTSDLDPLSFHALNKLGKSLASWTSHPERPRKVRIAVFSSLVGGGLSLATARAEAIRTYLITEFSGINSQNLTAVGSGQISSGSTVGDGSRVEVFLTP